MWLRTVQCCAELLCWELYSVHIIYYYITQNIYIQNRFSFMAVARKIPDDMNASECVRSISIITSSSISSSESFRVFRIVCDVLCTCWALSSYWVNVFCSIKWNAARADHKLIVLIGLMTLRSSALRKWLSPANIKCLCSGCWLVLVWRTPCVHEHDNKIMKRSEWNTHTHTCGAPSNA